MRGLAYRRHHNERILKRAERMLKSWSNDNEWIKWAVCRWADNMAKCSCDMCCNPRKHKILTLQEKRFKLHGIE